MLSVEAKSRLRDQAAATREVRFTVIPRDEALGGCSCCGAPEVSPLRCLDKGDHINVDDATGDAARTPEWTALWRRHSPDRDQPRVVSARHGRRVFRAARRGRFSVEIAIEQVEQFRLCPVSRETRPRVTESSPR